MSATTRLAHAVWTQMMCCFNNAMLCAQDLHYARTTRYRALCKEEEEEHFRGPWYLLGDSLAFDFGEVGAVRDFFDSIGGVKVSTQAALSHC